MFYCKKCGDKNNWPDGFRKSYGPCEICRVSAECSDVPSSQLPMPEKKK